MNLTRLSGRVGLAVQCFEPKRPFSSPSKQIKRIDRLGAIGKLEKARASSSDARRAAGIVVGARIDRPRRVVVARAAMAQVIVMGADDDHLVLEQRIASRQDGKDVAVVIAKRLEVALLLAGRLQRQLAKLFDQVVAGRMSARAARLASLEFRAGQVVDGLAHLLGGDRIDGGLVGGVLFRGQSRLRDRKNEQKEIGRQAVEFLHGMWRAGGIREGGLERSDFVFTVLVSFLSCKRLAAPRLGIGGRQKLRDLYAEIRQQIAAVKNIVGTKHLHGLVAAVNG